jgi:hypothetical protein
MSETQAEAKPKHSPEEGKTSNPTSRQASPGPKSPHNNSGSPRSPKRADERKKRKDMGTGYWTHTDQNLIHQMNEEKELHLAQQRHEAELHRIQKEHHLWSHGVPVILANQQPQFQGKTNKIARELAQLRIGEENLHLVRRLWDAKPVIQSARAFGESESQRRKYVQLHQVVKPRHLAPLQTEEELKSRELSWNDDVRIPKPPPAASSRLAAVNLQQGTSRGKSDRNADGGDDRHAEDAGKDKEPSPPKKLRVKPFLSVQPQPQRGEDSQSKPPVRSTHRPLAKAIEGVPLDIRRAEEAERKRSAARKKKKKSRKHREKGEKGKSEKRKGSAGGASQSTNDDGTRDQGADEPTQGEPEGDPKSKGDSTDEPEPQGREAKHQDSNGDAKKDQPATSGRNEGQQRQSPSPSASEKGLKTTAAESEGSTKQPTNTEESTKEEAEPTPQRSNPSPSPSPAKDPHEESEPAVASSPSKDQPTNGADSNVKRSSPAPSPTPAPNDAQEGTHEAPKESQEGGDTGATVADNAPPPPSNSAEGKKGDDHPADGSATDEQRPVEDQKPTTEDPTPPNHQDAPPDAATKASTE